MGMTATDRLRALLDERGVEWDYGITGAGTTKFDANGVDVTFTPMRDGLVCSTILTPEQAVEATLGRGTCHDANVGGYFVCSECEALVKLYSIGRSYVDEWGKRWYATSNDHGFNYCPNCGRRVES